MTNEREALPLVAMPGADRESRVERVAAPRAGTECHVEAVGRDARLWVVATQAQPVRPAKSDDDPARRRHADRDGIRVLAKDVSRRVDERRRVEHLVHSPMAIQPHWLEVWQARRDELRFPGSDARQRRIRERHILHRVAA